MLDQCGRKIDYLRISVTDRCNLRCMYCMPSREFEYLQVDDVLSLSEILRVVKAATAVGISKVRVTGGEPLLRVGVPGFIKDIKAVPGIEEVYLTTNGILLEKYADELKSGGLNRVNISLDTLKEDNYSRITRGGSLKTVMEGVQAAILKDISIRINTVILKGINDDEIMEFVRLAEREALEVRFIELMPIGEGRKHTAVTNDEIKLFISKERELTQEHQKTRNAGPAQYFSTGKGRGRVGFISPMTHSFCESCNRIRLTAEGYLKQCLHWKQGTDLKKVIREGIGDEELIKVLADTIYMKPSRHGFSLGDSEGDRRIMSQIGG